MSQGHAWAPVRRRGLDLQAGASPPTAGDDAPADFQLLSAWPQAFDAAVCAIAAVVVFPSLFLPGLAPPAGVAAGLAIWALAYGVRPLGGRIFANIEGAAARVILARLLFAASTTAFALLPGAAATAWAPGLLLACRLVQGLALGGLGEAGGSGRRRALTAVAGLPVAAGLFGVLAMALRRPDFLAWGWRYPYVIALAGNLPALFADLRLQFPEPRRRSSHGAGLRLVTVAGVAVEGQTRRAASYAGCRSKRTWERP